MQMKTIDQVAQYFQVHRNTVNNWIRAGKIKAVHVGRHVRIPADEIPRFIRENQIKAK